MQRMRRSYGWRWTPSSCEMIEAFLGEGLASIAWSWWVWLAKCPSRKNNIGRKNGITAQFGKTLCSACSDRCRNGS